ncbi:MAG: ABC transporter ATP-binding protein [Clostridiales bacterium]|nr:ABC transporter ATP-binding protein [Clostridiales bacterium]
MMAVRVENMTYAYKKEKNVLDHINFEIMDGEILSLLGPNGTGKTTLLKCVSHLLTPQEGKTYVDGTDIGSLSPRKRASLIGYVPQYGNQIFPLRVIDTILMGRTAVSGKITSTDKDIAFDVLHRLDLEKFAMKDTNELSGGQRQRVLIARALAQEPRLLVLDEPTSSLDLKNQLMTLEQIYELSRQKHISVLLSVHDLNLTSMFTDKVLILKDSEIFAYGTPRQTLTESMIHEVYQVNAQVIEDKDLYIKLQRKKYTP